MAWVEGEGDDDVTHIYTYQNYPYWVSMDDLPNNGFIPGNQNFNTYRRTQYITDMVASNKRAGTTNPIGRHFIAGQSIDTGLNSPAQGGLLTAWIGGISNMDDESKNPPGGWIISPAENLPCRGFGAVTCSLAARARQMWQLQEADNGIGPEDWNPGMGEVVVNYEEGTQIEYLSTSQIGGGLDLVTLSPGQFTAPPTLQDNFGENNVGPFKMSDFYDTGHWNVEIWIVESPTTLGGVEAIEIISNYFLGYPEQGGFGLKMIPSSEGQIHLGGNPTNPTGEVVYDGSDDPTDPTNEGENVPYINDDLGVNIAEGNVTSQNIGQNLIVTNPDAGTVDDAVNRHYGVVSDNIINVIADASSVGNFE
tara:strand:- start:157 stop:1248 length:1092 start_codon:yes stop_codon:yes gene_type:complete